MIYILGGQGFIGSAFKRWCQKHKTEHKVLTRENYNSHKGTECNIFINANGNSSKIFAKQDPIKDFDCSVRSVKQSLHDFDSELYIYLSSCDVYPDCSKPKNTRENSPIDVEQQGPYGFHKYLAEQCVKNAHKNWLVFRMGGFVGPGLKKNSIYDILFSKILWLDPLSELQFLRTDDAASIVMKIAKKNIKNEVFNLTGLGTVNLGDCMKFAKRFPMINPNSPRVKYNIDLGKLNRFTKIPNSKNTVFDFIKECLSTKSELNGSD